jgi:EAL and modified HD-GYP domain-containing signal transduction protein
MAQAARESPTALYVARQPILDERGRVFGYELLYRGSPRDTACFVRPDVASASVITSALLDLGLDTLTDGRLAFLNVTASLVIEQIDGLVRAGDVVLELLETIEVTEELVAACRRLRSGGYRLALDDFIPGSPAEALLPYVSFVKVDMLATSGPDAARLAERLRTHDVTMLAEKVETRDVYEEMRAAGYTLFQGYYFCKPVIQAGVTIAAQQMVYMRLLAALTNPNLGMLELEALVKQDVSLSHRVLRFVNSAAVPIRTEVGTIHQALLLIGMDPIRKWASVWCLAGLNQKSTPELATLALVRARACELLGSRARHPRAGAGLDASELFLVGLFSLLDVMLSTTMADALGNLPLSTASSDALLGRPSSYRCVLDAVIAFEGGAWDAASDAATRAGVDTAMLPEAYTTALRWAQDVTRGGITSPPSP